MTLTYGDLPDFGTFERLFAQACPDGSYTVKAGLSGLFQRTPYALGHGDEASYNCLALYSLLEACVKSAGEQEEAKACEEAALPIPDEPPTGEARECDLVWPTCLQDASDVLATLGVEWV